MSQEFQNSSLVSAVGASAVRGERMQNRFRRLFIGHPALTSAAVSLGFLAKAFLARRFCLEARASGIPQVMAPTSFRPGQMLFLGPLTGIVGGVLSGGFGHSLIGLEGMARPDAGHFGAHPIALAFIVAALGYLGHGLTCGAGYEMTRSLFRVAMRRSPSAD